MTRRWLGPAALAIMGLLVLAGFGARPAAATWSASYYIFDRAVWSPDGRQVGVIGEYFDMKTHQSFEDTLVVDVATGAITCVSPSALRFCLSRDGTRMMVMGRFGLYDHDMTGGRTTQIYYQHPFQPVEVVDFAYNRDMTGAVVLRCSDWDPEISGVYRLPLDGSPVEKMMSDPGCGSTGFNFFQTNRRRQEAQRPAIPTTQHPVSPEHFPGSLWQIYEGEQPGVAVWANGTAGSDTLCHNCRAEYVSWHPKGGSVLAATAPEDVHDIATPTGVFLLQPDRRPFRLPDTRIFSSIWPDTSFAFVLYGDGSVGVVDAVERTFRPLTLSMTPDWLKAAPLRKAEVWSVACEGALFPSPDSIRTVARARTSAGGAWAIDPTASGDAWQMSLGAFPDSATALREAGALARDHYPAGATGWTVRRRPVSRMLGSFRFGELASPDGRARIAFKSHPHMFQPYIGTELWLETNSGKPKPLIEGMSSF